MTDIFIIAAKRSAIGSYGGSLKDTAPIDLAIPVAQAAIEQSGLPATAIDHAVYGHVIHTEPRDMYSPRCISIGVGLADTAPAFQVNRLCGSGLQAIVSGIQLIQLGDAAAVLAGGVEVMSRGPYVLPAQRWGARMGDSGVIDMMLGALHDPFGIGHMGITAENVAQDYDISRASMDEFAAVSQARASAAQSAGYFEDQIVPLTIKQGRKDIRFKSDEFIRSETTVDSLANLRPAFAKDGLVTAGNSSGINDGSASIILADATKVASHNALPMARIVSYGFGGVPARIMGMGPVPASQMALERAGLAVNDLAVVESNEAFAAQACAVSKQLGLDASVVNPNGGAIALGHPVGATGAIIMTKLIYELRRRGERYGMATMCIGGGQGISVIIDGKP
jgi:acetyl-CoA C-acetyltransferase